GGNREGTLAHSFPNSGSGQRWEGAAIATFFNRGGCRILHKMRRDRPGSGPGTVSNGSRRLPDSGGDQAGGRQGRALRRVLSRQIALSLVPLIRCTFSSAPLTAAVLYL